MADYVVHCPNCKNIFIDDPDYNGRCPHCGHIFEEDQDTRSEDE